MKSKSHFSTAFIGLSHLGLTTSVGWTSLKQSVVGIDTDKNVINHLSQGKLLIMEDGMELNEPGLAELFRKVKKNYHPTSDFSKIAGCNLVFFAKDTPKDIKNPEKVILHLIEKSIPYFQNNVTIFIMSQVPVGFCRETQNHIKKERPSLSFSLYHWVDTIVMTNAVERFLKPERIIIGADQGNETLNSTIKYVLNKFSCPVFQMSYESAELTKAAINLYLAHSVTFANTLSDFCEVAGGDMNEIIPALHSDKRIGSSAYIVPNLRIAGGHLERDLSMLHHLAKKKKISPGIVDFIIKQNDKRFKWVINKLNLYLFPKIKNPVICLWGLSYKKDSTSTKNAASLEIIKALKNKSKLKVYDPMAIVPSNLTGYTRCKDKYEALTGAHCLLILTDWEEFSKTPVLKLKRLMKNYLIIDCVGIMHDRKEELKNFNYISIGVGNSIN